MLTMPQCVKVFTRKVPKTRKNRKIWNFRDFRDKAWNSAIYFNFREKSRNRGKPVSLVISVESTLLLTQSRSSQ